jgi:hypothetical protein
MEAYPGGGPGGWWGTSALHPTNYGATVWSPSVSQDGSKKLSDAISGYQPETGPDLSANFYTYSALWDSTGVEFFWDGKSIGKVNTTDQNTRMSISIFGLEAHLELRRLPGLLKELQILTQLIMFGRGL